MAQSKSSVSALIPTLSNTDGLKRLLKQLADASIPIIVVDNQPSALKKKLVEEVMGVYLPQDKNLGFAKSINTAARHASSEWLLLLNDDVLMTENNQIENLVKTAHLKAWAAISPVLATPTGEVENRGYRVLPIGKVELVTNEGHNWDEYLDGLTGACLLIKKAVFDELQGFDERFFMYLEDVDFCLRLKRAGYHFGVDLNSRVIHEHRKSSKALKGLKEKYDFINWWRIILKHWSWSTWLNNFGPILIERGRNLSGWVKTVWQ